MHGLIKIAFVFMEKRNTIKEQEMAPAILKILKKFVEQFIEFIQKSKRRLGEYKFKW